MTAGSFPAGPWPTCPEKGLGQDGTTYNTRVMSRPGSAVHIGIIAACFFTLWAAPVLAQVSPPAGIIKSVAGAVSVVRFGGQSSAVLGQGVFEGDTLKTGPDGRLGVTLKDGTRLSLGGNTELRIDSFAYAPAESRVGLVLKLLRGAITYVSGRIAQLAPGAVKIETPTSVIGIRGTHLLIGVDQP